MPTYTLESWAISKLSPQQLLIWLPTKIHSWYLALFPGPGKLSLTSSPGGEPGIFSLAVGMHIAVTVLQVIPIQSSKLALLVNIKILLGVHDMKQASHKAELGNYKHTVNM